MWIFKIIERIYSFYEIFYSKYKCKILRTNKVWIGLDCNLHGEGFIRIGKHTIIKKHSVIHAYSKWKDVAFSPSIIIGNNCNIGEYVHISAINKIAIGNNCLLGRRVTITDHSHGKGNETNTPPMDRLLFSKGPVLIGKDVWIGENVCILPNVTIGDGAIIGAGSIVTHNIPPYTVAVGVPAKVIKASLRDSLI